MARMIPPDYPPGTPAGEAIVFGKLRHDPDTAGWVVLHSLDLRRHRTKTEGEADMVILVPGLGVMCLEIKGCEVSRQEGMWIYPYGRSIEGPFRQASRAMHSLREYLAARDGNLAGLLFISAVAFTRIHFNEESPEWHSWQIIDSPLLARTPISQVIQRIFEKAHRHVASRPGNRTWYDEKASRPADAQIRRMTDLLRGNFECSIHRRSDIQRIEESLLRLTQEQYDALDLIDENQQVVVKGLAGTGKTVLAIEAAIRAARANKRVLLICFNRLLADWMKATVNTRSEGVSGTVRVSHLHGLLREIAGTPPAVRDNHEFWAHELPLRAVDTLLDEHVAAPRYDLLLVDEAQDVLTNEYLDVLDLLLEGGLAGGHWVLFGDFERQAIYLRGGGETAASMLTALRTRAPHHASATLRINCRNAGPIVETLTLACSIDPGYSRFLHEMEGASVDPRFWKGEGGQEALLRDAFRELHSVFKADEIVILSLSADERSCASRIAADMRLTPCRSAEPLPEAAVGSCHATIHAFKGLEAPAIVITDILRLDELTRALLYVGMSRARVRLVLLLHESCRGDYDRMLEAGLHRYTGR